jgi:hypothetical protein
LLTAVVLWLMLDRSLVFALVTFVAAVQAFLNYRRLLEEESPARKRVHEGLLGAVRFIGLITLAMAGSAFR